MVAQPQIPVKPDPPVRLLSGFYEIFPDVEPQTVLLAPGKAVWVAAVATSGHQYHLYNADREKQVRFTWRSAGWMQTIMRRPLPRWSRYPAGVIHHLQAQSFEFDIPAINLVIACDEPDGPAADFGAGVAVAALWYDLAGADYTHDSLVQVVDTVRRKYIEK